MANKGKKKNLDDYCKEYGLSEQDKKDLRNACSEYVVYELKNQFNDEKWNSAWNWLNDKGGENQFSYDITLSKLKQMKKDYPELNNIEKTYEDKVDNYCIQIIVLTSQSISNEKQTDFQKAFAEKYSLDDKIIAKLNNDTLLNYTIKQIHYRTLSRKTRILLKKSHELYNSDVNEKINDLLNTDLSLEDQDNDEEKQKNPPESNEIPERYLAKRLGIEYSDAKGLLKKIKENDPQVAIDFKNFAIEQFYEKLYLTIEIETITQLKKDLSGISEREDHIKKIDEQIDEMKGDTEHNKYTYEYFWNEYKKENKIIENTIKNMYNALLTQISPQNSYCSNPEEFYKYFEKQLDELKEEDIGIKIDNDIIKHIKTLTDEQCERDTKRDTKIDINKGKVMFETTLEEMYFEEEVKNINNKTKKDVEDILIQKRINQLEDERTRLSGEINQLEQENTYLYRSGIYVEGENLEASNRQSDMPPEIHIEQGSRTNTQYISTSKSPLIMLTYYSTYKESDSQADTTRHSKYLAINLDILLSDLTKRLDEINKINSQCSYDQEYELYIAIEVYLDNNDDLNKKILEKIGTRNFVSTLRT